MVYRQLKLIVNSFILITVSIVYIFFPKNSLATEIISNWTNASKMPDINGIASHYSFIFGNKLYSLGGANSSVIPNGLFSTINPSGLLSTWTDINSPFNLFWHSGAIYNNYIYIIGGTNSSIQNITNVDFGVIGSDGDISSWQSTIPLPLPLALGNAITLNDKIYFAGGSIYRNETSGSKDEIYKASIDLLNGTLDTWFLIGHLPEPMVGFGMVEINNYLYIIGGDSKYRGILSEVRRAPINTDGTIGTWEVMTSLPLPSTRASVTKAANLLISVGGISTGNTYLNQVYFANINSDGTISKWQTSPYILPNINCCSSLVFWNNYLYLIGGHDGTPFGYYNDVFTAKVISDTPEYISLNVPDLKQFEGGWENNLYGHTDKTIKDYGCALTSASMILKFFGHNINPGELNMWLNAQKDGYIKNNLVNWLAISRYTKLHESTSSPTLEYLRSSLEANKILNNLQNNLPTIVKVPGHFVVTKSQTETSFGINDPGYSDRDELLPEYPDNHIKSLNTYTPSQTDLSYMMFVGDNNLKFELFDSLENPIDPSMIQTFIEDPIDELYGEEKSGESLSVLLFSKPTLGKYILKVKNIGELNSKYNFDAYLYDSDGDIIQKTFSEYFFPNDIYSYNIDFLENKEISLKNSGLYKSIIKKVNRVNQDTKLANNLIRQIENLTPKLLSQGFSLNLLSKLKSLIF